MCRVSAKFVPLLLTEDQQFQRLATSSDLFQSESDDPDFMKLIITGDKSIPKQSSSRHNGKPPGSPRPKKARQVRSKIKVMLIVFLDADGIVHHEYAPLDQTVNKEFYLDVMRRLREAVRSKRPVLWASSRWMFHHDGAPNAHRQSYAARNNPSSTSSYSRICNLRFSPLSQNKNTLKNTGFRTLKP
ncbi:HTH_48 domain-containing protein [Trichonephila clavipes]|nr:HTH_48 domain-containing protein [Trichonephila clavipes]